MAETQALNWRELLEKHHSALVDELRIPIDADVREAAGQATALAHAEGDIRVAEARVEARRAVADSLHQSIRRLRQASGEIRILKVLNEVTAPWAAQSVVLVFENHQARSVALRGISLPSSDPEVPTIVDAPRSRPGSEPATPTDVVTDNLVFDITAAPAIVAAIESRDPVIALLSPRELSVPLADALGVDPGSRASVYPILVRQAVVAVLVAAGTVSTPQLELLCEAAAMRLEASAPAAAPSPDINFVQIAQAGVSAHVAANASEKLAWEDLSTDQQRLHLQAQRMARLRTAEMRLYQPDPLQRGVAAGDIYGALKSQIDAARSEFLQTYLSKSDSMVDYLHLEILHTLAHDDDRLLGPGYPGPMV